MAPKRSTPLDDPPSASSDDEETEDEQEQQPMTHKRIEESSSEEEEEEEESEEETIDDVKNPLEKPKIQNPNSKTAELSSEEDSESDSEGETPTPVKTLVAKPQTLTPKSPAILDSDSELRSPTASDFVIKPSKKFVALSTPEKTPASKRPSSESDLKDKKKVKVSNGDLDDEKKSVIKRVWSEDDELLLLQVFIDYQSKNECSPLSNMDRFYQFAMDYLPGNASKSQLYEKIRRLKKKFRVNSEKVTSTGEDPVFPKVHDRKVFEISKKIWGIGGCESLSGGGGGGGGGGSNPKPKVKTPKAKPKVEVKEEDKDDEIIAQVEDFETLYPCWNAGLNSEYPSSLKAPSGFVDLIKENLSLIGEAKAKEMDEKWEALFKDEAALRKRRIALLNCVDDVETSSLRSRGLKRDIRAKKKGLQPQGVASVPNNRSSSSKGFCPRKKGSKA